MPGMSRHGARTSPSSRMARTLLNEPVVLFRTEAGAVAALEDRCCHRAMPLSCGAVFGNNIRCEYHGMVFDGAGICVEIPGQQIIPKSARVRSFPVVESDDLVWIWMGASGTGRSETDRPLSVASVSGRTRCKTEQIDCNYLLLSDNLLDQTHAAYVHKSTLASNVDAYERAEMKIAPTQDGVKFIRWMLNCIPPGIYSKAVKFKGPRRSLGRVRICRAVLHPAIHRRPGRRRRRLRARCPRRRIWLAHLLRHHAGDRAHELVHVVDREQLPAERAGGDRRTIRGNRDAPSRKTRMCWWRNTRRLRNLGDRPLINIASDGARVQARLALERKIAAGARYSPRTGRHAGLRAEGSFRNPSGKVEQPENRTTMTNHIAALRACRAAGLVRRKRYRGGDQDTDPA